MINTQSGEDKPAPSGGYEVLSSQESATLAQIPHKLRAVTFELRRSSDRLFMVIPVPDGLTEKLTEDIAEQISHVSRVILDRYDHEATHMPPLGVANQEFAVEAVWRKKRNIAAA
jgi:hypothetical protein